MEENEFFEHLLYAGALSLLLYFISSVLLGKFCSSYFKGGEKLVIKFSNLFRPHSIKVTGLSFEPRSI